MKKVILLVVVVSLLALVLAVAVSAGGPNSNCPPVFELHEAMNHDDEHEHKHAGTSADKNGDGWICVKHVTEDIHVHIDNNAH
jgi:hypothetical protein